MLYLHYGLAEYCSIYNCCIGGGMACEGRVARLHGP